LNHARYDRRRTRHVLGRKHDSESRRDHLLQMACVTSAVRNLGWIKAREVSLPEACRNLATWLMDRSAAGGIDGDLASGWWGET
jgi:hypothetical protein